MIYSFKVRVWDTYIAGPGGEEYECSEMTTRVEAESAEEAIRAALAKTGRSHGEVASVREWAADPDRAPRRPHKADLVMAGIGLLFMVGFILEWIFR